MSGDLSIIVNANNELVPQGLRLPKSVGVTEMNHVITEGEEYSLLKLVSKQRALTYLHFRQNIASLKLVQGETELMNVSLIKQRMIPFRMKT